MALSAGTVLGPYQIESALGAGGMGEVYRARDTRLNRTVAIKILPHDKFADPERQARFLREARVASALNHPRIVTLHDIIHDHGIDVLVMEYVPGKSLAELIPSKGVPLVDALNYAQQMADALAAAHAAGIVHRDIKPANVLVTPQGQVKVLDFGLAKLAEQVAETRTQVAMLTEPGQVMGTVAYMSPEQAGGREVDYRTDIFSLGVVLYELVTGRRPFQGTSSVETMHAILHDAFSRIASVPPELDEILAKALAKEPKDRYQHAGDFELDLRRFQRAWHTKSLLSLRGATAPSSRHRWRMLAGAVAASAIVTGTAGWFALRPAPPRANPLQDAQFSRLTDFGGDELDAAVSADGKFVAFIADRNGPFHVWSGQIGTGRYVDLTPGPDDQQAPVRSVGFSPDGSEMWLGGGPDRRLRLMPFMGGAPRFFLRDHVVNVAWSPDGQRMVYHTRDDGDPIFVADRIGSSARQIFVGGPGVHNHYLAWSRDVRWIYFVSGVLATAEMDLYRIPPSGGAAERLTGHNAEVSYITPLNEGTILYTAQDQDRSGPWLWAFDTERKDARRLSFGLEKYSSVAASADGRRIVATVANPTASLWSVPILDHPAGEDAVKPFPLPNVRALAPRFGGMSLFYLSSLGGGDGLWRFQGGQAREIWKGADGALFEAPGVSVDGSRIAVVLRKLGRLTLHVLSADGAQLQPIAQSIDVRGSASWSPDGKWIVIGGSDAAGAGLFKIPLDGSAPIRLVTGQALSPIWSPDGNLIVYAGQNIAASSPLLAVRPDGTSVPLPTIRVLRAGDRYRFLPDGRGLVYQQSVFERQDFWLLDMATQKSRQLTKSTNTSTMRTFDVTPDGKQIVFDRRRENSDVVLIDLPK